MKAVETLLKLWVAGGMLAGAIVAFVVFAPVALLLKLNELLNRRDFS